MTSQRGPTKGVHHRSGLLWLECRGENEMKFLIVRFDKSLFLCILISMLMIACGNVNEMTSEQAGRSTGPAELATTEPISPQSSHVEPVRVTEEDPTPVAVETVQTPEATIKPPQADPTQSTEPTLEPTPDVLVASFALDGQALEIEEVILDPIYRTIDEGSIETFRTDNDEWFPAATWDNDHSMWFASPTVGVLRYDGVAWQNISEIASLDDTAMIQDITVASDGTIYVASCKGLYHLEDQEWVDDLDEFAIDEFDDEICINDVKIGPSGDIWVNREKDWDWAGATHIEESAGASASVDDGASPVILTEVSSDIIGYELLDIEAMADGTTWFNTREDIKIYDGQEWHQMDIPELMMIFAWAGGPSGDIWTTSWDYLYHGDGTNYASIYGFGDVAFSKYDGHTWTNYLTSDAEDLVCMHMAVSPDGALWALCLFDVFDYLKEHWVGLFHFDGEELTVYQAQNNELDFPFELRSSDTWDMVIDGEGVLWLVGVDGIFSFTPPG